MSPRSAKKYPILIFFKCEKIIQKKICDFFRKKYFFFQHDFSPRNIYFCQLQVAFIMTAFFSCFLYIFYYNSIFNIGFMMNLFVKMSLRLTLHTRSIIFYWTLPLNGHNVAHRLRLVLLFISNWSWDFSLQDYATRDSTLFINKPVFDWKSGVSVVTCKENSVTYTLVG